MDPILIVLFIILIYVAYAFWDPSDRFVTTMILALISAGSVLFWWSYKSNENLVTPDMSNQLEDVNNQVYAGEDARSSDLYDLNESGNVLMRDAPPYDAQVKDLELPRSDEKGWDPQAIVARYIKGASTHIPQEAHSDDYYAINKKTYPTSGGSLDGSPMNVYAQYQEPLNERALSMDDKLARKQQHRADINKRAIDGRVRATKNLYEKYFANELAENEARDWWDGEASDNENDYLYP